MGGSGSGNFWRWGTKDTCEGYTRIELPFMRKRGMLRPGYHGTLSWNLGGEPAGNIHFKTHSDGLELIYRFREREGEWRSVNERVPFSYSKQRLGGVRTWLTCLSCGRKCSILFGGTYYRCRKCWNLAYQSQREAPHWRAISKAQKLRKRLGGSESLDDPFPEKPKGMHWRTYERLAVKSEALESTADALGLAALMRFI